MKKLLVLVVASVVLFAACGSTAPTAYTVNGERTSQKSVDDELEQFQKNKDYRDAVGLGDVQGAGKGTFKAEFVAQIVTRAIYYELVSQELDKRNASVSAADLANARKELESQIAADPQTGQPDTEKGKEILAKFSESYQETLVRRQAEVSKLQKILSKTDTSDAALKKYFDAHQEDFTQVCAKHVLVDTKAEADAVAAELKGGADFAAVAKAKSKDTGSAQQGGDLGCASPGQYVDEFKKATLDQPIGAIGDPVQTQFGFHVIQVYDRKAPAFDDATKDKVRQQLEAESGNAINTWLEGAIKKATVKLNARYGTWDKTPSDGSPGHVVPPAEKSSSGGGESTTTSAP